MAGVDRASDRTFGGPRSGGGARVGGILVSPKATAAAREHVVRVQNCPTGRVR